MNSEVIWYKENKELIGYGIQLISCVVVFLGVWLTQKSMDKRAKNDNDSRLEQMKVQINEDKNKQVLEYKLKKAEELYEVLQEARVVILKFIDENKLEDIEKSELYIDFFEKLENLMYDFSKMRIRLELLVSLYFPDLKRNMSLIQQSEKGIKPRWTYEEFESREGLEFTIDGLAYLVHYLNITMNDLFEQVNVTKFDLNN